MWRRVRWSFGFKTMLEFCFYALRITRTRGWESENATQPDRFFIKDTQRKFWICINSLVRRISSLILITSRWGFMVKAGGSLEEHCENTGE